MNNKKKDIYKKALIAFQEMSKSLEEIPNEINNEDTHELLDGCYAYREITDLLNEARKKAERIKEQYEVCLGVRWVKAPVDRYRTPYCSGVPVLKVYAKTPSRKKDPESYAAVMSDLGVPRELWEHHEAIRINYKGWVDMITERLSKGQSLPLGCSMDDTISQYSVSVRKNKEILE